MLIMIEGIDGAGKSSAILELFKNKGAFPKPCVFLNTPGSGIPGIRDILLNPERGVSPLTQPFLFLGEMVHITERMLIPFNNDCYIFFDRFFLSTFVYQYCCKSDLMTNSQQKVIVDMIDHFMPTFDHTFILTVEMQQAINRSKNLMEFRKRDNFEADGMEEWEKRKKFYENARTMPIAHKLGNIRKIDTTDIGPEFVAGLIITAIKEG
jgi:thymidylate kinase